MSIEDNILPTGTRDTRLLERAVRERWPIPERYKKAIINRQIKIAIDPESSGREARAAARTIIAADKINLEEEIKSTPAIHLHQHSQETIDYDKVPTAELLEMDAKLAELLAKYPAEANVSGRTP